MKVWLGQDERYPNVEVRAEGPLVTYDFDKTAGIPRELYERHERALEEYNAVQGILLDIDNALWGQRASHREFDAEGKLLPEGEGP